MNSKIALRIPICYSSLLRKIRPREVKPVAQGHNNQGLSDTINKMYASFTLNILYPGSMRRGNADTFL